MMQTLQKIVAVVVVCTIATGAFGQGAFPPNPPTNFGNMPNLGLPGLGAATAPAPAGETAAPVDTGLPDVRIAEAAGTLTDPSDFIYLSKEYVFNLLVLASTLNIPGVTFDADLLPRSRAATRRGSSGEEIETRFVSGSTAGGRRTAEGARYMAGANDEERVSRQPVDRSQWLDAVSVSGNAELGKLLELVENLPEWQRVGRFPLLTTEKKKIDTAVAGIYSLAFNLAAPQYQRQSYDTYSDSYGDEEVDYYGDSARPPAGQYGQPPGATGQPPQGPPPVDPQAMGEWYYYYQQMIGWERYVAEETLLFQQGENEENYDLGNALQPENLYLVPQPENAPPPVIHFDAKETNINAYLSVVRPNSSALAVDQMRRMMEEWAEKRAEEDSEKSREFVARLNARKERRFRYREWLNDRATEVRKLAEDYRRRLDGDAFAIEGVEILVTQEPLRNVPLNSINVVTNSLTPYDLLESDGTLRKPKDEPVD